MLNLKANDQKPPKNKPTIETDLSEAADKSDPPYSQEYFNLMDMIDNTDKQIEYYKMVYTAEIDGLPKRRHSLKTHFIYNVIFLILLLGYDYFHLTVIVMGGGMILRTITGLIALGVLILATIYMIGHTIRAYILYQINMLPDFMTDYLQKYNIHTMVEEEAYCRNVLRQMLAYETTLSHIKKAAPKTTTEINAAMSEISAMNFDIKDFHYNAGRTIK